jgi:hypothetical protein
MHEHISISENVRKAGQYLSSPQTSAELFHALNNALREFIGWPFKVESGLAGDSEGNKTDEFGTLIYAGSETATSDGRVELKADGLACVIDVYESMGLQDFRLAYERIARAKKLKKSPPSHVPGVPTTTVTLGIIFSRDTILPLESLAQELDRLNRQHPDDRAWVDMVVVLSKGVINYAVQFPGGKVLGDYLPPAADTSPDRVPPLYVVLVVKPTGDFTFNKMSAFLVAHLAIFSPGANLPNFVYLLEGAPKDVLTICGYQYDLSSRLVPVPREFYNDRLLPQRPYLIQDGKGKTLSSLLFVPWQDGGVIILRGKLPLEGLLVFLGKEVMSRAAKINQPPDTQISYVLPITYAHFRQLVARIRNQSNMTVIIDPTEFVVQKFAEEGSRSPFMARIFMGVLRLRDVIFPDSKSRDPFDKAYEFVMMTLLNARASALEIKTMVEKHVSAVNAGQAARIQGPNIQVDEPIDKELRKEFENFVNLAGRVLKHGMQKVTDTLQVNIGFLFKKQHAFEKGLSALRAADNSLADYLSDTRKWSERLIEQRNAIEHDGWMLPKFIYARTAAGGVRATQPQASGQPATEFVEYMLDRLSCFVEEVAGHCLQVKMPVGISITELPLGQRVPEMPERFRLALTNGGTAIWRIAYSVGKFEEK